MSDRVDEVQAARLFVLMRGRKGPTETEDVDALAQLLRLYALQGVKAGLLKSKDIYRELHSGGCKMLSEGSGCKCFLCQIDEMTADVVESR